MSCTLVLGDGIAEGYGRAQNDHVTCHFKADTGTPHLNFGASVVFGLTQTYLLGAPSGSTITA